MKKIIFCLVLSCTLFSFAQSKPFQISGTLISEEGNLPLESATVHLERVKDSSLVTYTISDKDGKFELEGRNTDKSLNLFISYVGYKTYKKTVVLDKAEIKLGTINLETDTNALDEVVITSRAPITVKKDTLEFNVSSFKTKKDANVEDLLKKLPGVEVTSDGKIKVNGKEVNKILVNGKPFFGNDPTITTRSLTKDIIEKVQITDTKTKAQAFTGEEGDDTSKTINLTIKKENNKGVFGRMSAGGGTNERYELSGMLNWFDNDRHISVVSGKNNLNSSGFNLGGIGGMRMGRGGSSGGGLTTSENIGINYGDKWRDMDVSGGYFKSGSTSENENTSERENILADSRYFSNSNSRSFNERRSERANMAFEIKIDTTLFINIRPSFNTSNGESISDRNQESLNDLRVLTNESRNKSFNQNTSKSFSNNIDISKRFKRKGSYLSLSISNSVNNNESDNILDSETNFYELDETTQLPILKEELIRKQITNGDQKSIGFNTNITYSVPLLDDKLFLNTGYKYSRNKEKDKRNTYDFDEALRDYNYNKLNEALSTDFESVNEESNPWVGLRYKREKWSLRAGGGYVFRTLQNKDALRSALNTKRDFKAFEANSRLRYRFNPKMSLGVGYRLRNRSPRLNQLQVFENVSNPLNTVVGNPNLEPTKSHNINGRFQNYNFQKGVGFFGHVGAGVIENQIVTKTTIAPQTLKRETTYANVSGNFNFNSSISAMKTIKIDTLKSIRLSAGLSSGINKYVNFNNNVKYASKTTNLSPNMSVAFNWKDIMDIEAQYSLSNNNTKYDIDALKNQKFLTHSVRLRTSTTFPKKLEWENNISYNYNSQIADGFQKSAWFWNATMTYSMLKDKGFLSLKVYDLLNQNTNARRIATANYIEDVQSTVLKQYFMLSFSWKFNSLGKRGEQGGRYGRGRRVRYN